MALNHPIKSVNVAIGSSLGSATIPAGHILYKDVSGNASCDISLKASTGPPVAPVSTFVTVRPSPGTTSTPPNAYGKPKEDTTKESEERCSERACKTIEEEKVSESLEMNGETLTNVDNRCPGKTIIIKDAKREKLCPMLPPHVDHVTNTLCRLPKLCYC